MVHLDHVHLRRCLALAWSTGALALAAPCAAQDVAAAEALFTRGLSDMKAGQYETGCPAIAESHRLDPRPGTLFTLAECEAQRGRIATAAALYGDFLSLLARVPPDQRRKHSDREQRAIAMKAELGSQVPRLTLRLPPHAPTDTLVRRDGVALAGPSLGLGLPMDPGEHTISVEAPGRPTTEVKINLIKGEDRQVMLEVKTSAGPSTSPEPKEEARPRHVSAAVLQPASDVGPSRRRVVALAAGGLGSAGLVVGGITGALTLGQKGTITANCGPDRVCNHEGRSAVDSAQTTGLVSTIGFGVGLLGTGVAVALLLTEPASPNGATTARHESATWIYRGVFSWDRGGAVLGLQGAW
jgi:hypothetical protein